VVKKKKKKKKKKLFLFQYGMKRKGQHAGWGRRSGDTWFRKENSNFTKLKCTTK
jgi:hypothetical protein